MDKTILICKLSSPSHSSLSLCRTNWRSCKKIYVFGFETWNLYPGPALASAGPDWKQFCGAPLSGGYRNFWGASSHNDRYRWCERGDPKGTTYRFALAVKLIKLCPITLVFGKTSVVIVGDPPWAKESLAFRLITPGLLVRALALLNTIWSARETFSLWCDSSKAFSGFSKVQ